MENTHNEIHRFVLAHYEVRYSELLYHFAIFDR